MWLGGAVGRHVHARWRRNSGRDSTPKGLIAKIGGGFSFYVIRRSYRSEVLPRDGRMTKFGGARLSADETGAASGRRRLCSMRGSQRPAASTPSMATAAAKLFLHSLQPPAPAGEPRNGDL
uniref:Uncharacterized protein n=1 Tax=Oryza barthii TaxID=65489 RepID=A0A0D3H1Y1_9ORYZ